MRRFWRRPRRRDATTLLLWGGAVVLLALALRQVEPAAVWRSLTGLASWQLLLLAAANVVAIVVFAGRWWVIVRGLGHAVGLPRLTGYRLAGFGVSFVTPGPLFGGEPLQVLLLTRRHGIPAGAALGSVTLDKTIELCANFAFLSAGVVLLLRSGAAGDLLGPSALLIVGLLLLLPLLYLAALSSGRRPLTYLTGLLPRRWAAHGRLRSLRAAVLEAESSTGALCRRDPAAVAGAAALSGASWALQIGEFWLMLTLIGAETSLLQALILLTLMRLSFLLPFPGGLGAMEAALLFGFGLFGLAPVLGVTAVVLIRVRDLIFALGGLAWGLRQLNSAPRALPTPTQLTERRNTP